jgi:hypothetical protein
VVSLASTFLSRLRKPETAGDQPGPPAAQAHASRALPRFIAGLSTVDDPVLLDLGPVVGANVTFFGDLGCKLIVESLGDDVDRHVREDRVNDLPSFLDSRFPQETASVDGIICWDLFDYLQPAAGQVLARELVRVLRPEGMLLALFRQSAVPSAEAATTCTRHVVVDRRTLEYRPCPGTRQRQRPLLNRDIQRMFEPLAIVDQFLLRTNVREIVLRKPAAHS